MVETVVRNNRLEWIDWMKAWGIYLVVLGHFYSVGEKFIYVFHVPLFFVISGFLTKRESQISLFWKKLWYNLAVPMLIMATLNVVIDCALDVLQGTFSPMVFYWFLRNVAFGMVSGFDALWFVYTLIIMKIIFQYSPSKVFYSLILVFWAFVYAYNHIDTSGFPFFLKEPNAALDVFISFPFFALGVFLHDYRSMLNEWSDRPIMLLMAVCCFVLVCVCTLYNGNVGLYCCYDGGNMLLFLIGGVTGSVMVFAVSKMLGKASKLIVVISRGTIITLGFHKLFIALIREFFPASSFDMLFAVLVVMLFVPIIIWVEKYFPLMVGKYRKKN